MSAIQPFNDQHLHLWYLDSIYSLYIFSIFVRFVFLCSKFFLCFKCCQIKKNFFCWIIHVYQICFIVRHTDSAIRASCIICSSGKAYRAWASSINNNDRLFFPFVSFFHSLYLPNTIIAYILFGACCMCYIIIFLSFFFIMIRVWILIFFFLLLLCCCCAPSETPITKHQHTNWLEWKNINSMMVFYDDDDEED